MEEKGIDQVIDSLSRIEKSAESIRTDTEARKARYGQEIENKIWEFDAQLEEQHTKDMKELVERLEKERSEAMLKMRADMAIEVGKLDEAYEKNHTAMAKEILEMLIK